MAGAALQGADDGRLYVDPLRVHRRRRRASNPRFDLRGSVQEQRCCKVPYCVCRMVPQECVKCVPHCECRMEPYCVTRKVCRCVPVCVPECEPACPEPCCPQSSCSHKNHLHEWLPRMKPHHDKCEKDCLP